MKIRRILIVIALLASNLFAAVTQSQGININAGRVGRLMLGGQNRVLAKHDTPLWKAVLINQDDVSQIILTSISQSDKYHVSEVKESPEKSVWVIKDSNGTKILQLVTTYKYVGSSLEFCAELQHIAKKYQLDSLWYPSLPLKWLGRQMKDDKLLLPRGVGQIIEKIHLSRQIKKGRGSDLISCVERSHYPSKLGNLQMQYYFDDDGGIMFSTYDTTRCIKDFVLTKTQGGLCANWIHYPNSEQLTKINPSMAYSVSLRWVAGDWYDAARIYRNWALNQKWSKKPGSLAARQDIPSWFASMPSWVRIPQDPAVSWDEKKLWPVQWAKAVGTPMMLHWYGWDEKAGPLNEANWPEYYKPRKDFDKMVEFYRDNGIRVMPYTNARLICMDGVVWPKYKNYAVRMRDSKPAAVEDWPRYTTKAGYEQALKQGLRVKASKKRWHIFSKFAVGCPFYDKWQKLIIAKNMMLFDKGRVDGVYQDQVGVWALRCFAKNHGHVPGDGLAWVKGMEAMYARLNDELAARGLKKMLVAEYPNEVNLPYIQGALTVEPSLLMRYKPVPLFQAIYHTHFATIGWDDNPSEIKKSPEIYLHQRMLPLVYGSQLGWISYIMPSLISNHPKVVDCFRQAVDLRRRFPGALGCGKMLRPPVVSGVSSGKAPTATPGRGVNSYEWPGVLAGFFKDVKVSGQAVAVLVNWRSVSQKGTVELDISEVGEKVTAAWGDGKNIGRFDGTVIKIDFEIPAMSTACIVLKSKSE